MGSLKDASVCRLTRAWDIDNANILRHSLQVASPDDVCIAILLLTMSQSAAFRRLLDVLRQRDIPLGRDDVGSAFESPKTRDEIVKWVEEHLNNSTLLSKDELRLYVTAKPVHLCSILTCIRYRNLPPSIDDGLVAADPVARPIRDDELRTAINALKQSTAVIERHKKSLETQKQALIEIKAETEGHDLPGSHANHQHDANQQRLRESSQLAFAVSSLITQTVAHTDYSADRRFTTFKL